MTLKKLHYFSGIVITIFVLLHLFNHVSGILGATVHIEIMDKLRIIYRNTIVETILLIAVFIQIISGIKLLFEKRKSAEYFFEKLQIWTGIYLALFFLIHLSAIVFGRLILKLDTNFYFGTAGMNTYPHSLFFIPYYSLAIISFFGHIAAVHSSKMKHSILKITPAKQAYSILATGILISFVIIYCLTNRFDGVEIPKEYLPILGM